jgi:hypothetical protein
MRGYVLYTIRDIVLETVGIDHNPPRCVKSDTTTAARQKYMRKTSPEVPGAIRARLAYLRSRKAALDELIHCLERYELYLSPARKLPAQPRLMKGVAVKSEHGPPLKRSAGAA